MLKSTPSFFFTLKGILFSPFFSPVLDLFSLLPLHVFFESDEQKVFFFSHFLVVHMVVAWDLKRSMFFRNWLWNEKKMSGTH